MMYRTRSLNLWMGAMIASSLAAGARGEISLGFFPEDSMLDISGEVVVLTDKVLEVRGFTYDGSAPDAFFWADENADASSDGFILLQASNECSSDILTAANGTEVIRLEFPTGKSIDDVKGGSLSVWCRTMTVNLGQVDIPVETLEDSLVADEEEFPLLCADVAEAGFFGRVADQARTWWNVLVWLPTRLFVSDEN